MNTFRVVVSASRTAKESASLGDARYYLQLQCLAKACLTKQSTHANTV